MRFKNPANGHIETSSIPGLWMILFGGIYMMVAGLWRAFAVWLVLAATFYSTLGAAGTIPVVVTNIVYAIMASNLVRSNYLRKGWIEVADDEEPADLSSETPPHATIKCPFCAEEIKAEAIKCKHCGSLLNS